MTVSTLVEASYEEKYQQAKQNFLNFIYNNSRTIILFGPGGNGKSHMTAELKDILEYHDYVVYQETYSWDDVQFVANIDNPEKKVLHFCFNPFDKWNIENQTEASLVDMSNMKW